MKHTIFNFFKIQSKPVPKDISKKQHRLLNEAQKMWAQVAVKQECKK